MKQVLTIVVKLQPTPEQAAKMDATLQAFADVCNDVNDNTDPKLTNKITLQALTYQTIKEKYALVANMAVRACARVGANRKTAKLKGKPVKKFAPTSMDCDQDLFTFREQDWQVSLATVQGREKVQLKVGNYQRGKLKGAKPTSAQLCKHGDGNFYLHIQLKEEAPEPIQSSNVIGVDFGRRDIAVTSQGDKWDGKQITDTRDKFSQVRASLQKHASKGTRSTRRRARQVLQRLSGRERSYQTWLNHNISKWIVLFALQHNAIIAIEELTGIRERTNTLSRNKTERSRSNSWAFFQLRMFLSYKGMKFGVSLVAVPPAYTSKSCHLCLVVGNRSGKSFKCVNERCDWAGDADENASRVIELVGGSFVNLPGGSERLSCSLSYDSLGLLKAPRESVSGEG